MAQPTQSLKRKPDNEPSPLSKKAKSSSLIVLFDLETTDLLKSDIVQISTKVFKGDEAFNVYIIPRYSFFNGFNNMECSNGKLLHRGVEVENAYEYQEGLRLFHQYLLHLSGGGQKIVLAAQNCKRFDAPTLIHAFKSIGVTRDVLEDLDICFSDTAEVLPEKTKMEDLCKKHLGREYLHTGEEDVQALNDLLLHFNIGASQIEKNVFYPFSVWLEGDTPYHQIERDGVPRIACDICGCDYSGKKKSHGLRSLRQHYIKKHAQDKLRPYKN